jgi:hypothetical protein
MRWNKSFVIESAADGKCSRRVLLTDAVEKVGDTPAARNNRIIGGNFLNRTCAFDAYLESILLTDPPQNRFLTASTLSGPRWLGSPLTLAPLQATIAIAMKTTMP